MFLKFKKARTLNIGIMTLGIHSNECPSSSTLSGIIKEWGDAWAASRRQGCRSVAPSQVLRIPAQLIELTHESRLCTHIKNKNKTTQQFIYEFSDLCIYIYKLNKINLGCLLKILFGQMGPWLNHLNAIFVESTTTRLKSQCNCTRRSAQQDSHSPLAGIVSADPAWQITRPFIQFWQFSWR